MAFMHQMDQRSIYPWDPFGWTSNAPKVVAKAFMPKTPYMCVVGPEDLTTHIRGGIGQSMTNCMAYLVWVQKDVG